MSEYQKQMKESLKVIQSELNKVKKLCNKDCENCPMNVLGYYDENGWNIYCKEDE